ncbi:MAG: cyclic nucleotide-binding domain-containing protein [Desulfobacterales bacterium]
MNSQLLRHILRGEIRIDSPEALACLLAEAPGCPELLKMHARLLAAHERPGEARARYREAAGRFLAEGRILAAWSAELSAWRLGRPSAGELAAFQGEIDRSPPGGGPADAFLRSLARRERLAVLACCRRSRVPAGEILLRPGAPPEDLHLVVEGTLRESRYETVEEKPRRRRPPSRTLREGDAFGDVYPFQERRPSSSLVEAVGPAEILAIPRGRLMRACRRHPAVERGLVRLCGLRSDMQRPAGEEGIRRGDRYRIPVPMRVEVATDGLGRGTLRLEGLSHDLSVSGVSFVPETDGLPPPPADPSACDPLVGRRVKAALHGPGVALEIAGRIVRRRTLLHGGRRRSSLAIEFEELPPHLRGLLFAFAGSLAAAKPKTP